MEPNEIDEIVRWSVLVDSILESRIARRNSSGHCKPKQKQAKASHLSEATQTNRISLISCDIIFREAKIVCRLTDYKAMQPTFQVKGILEENYLVKDTRKAIVPNYQKEKKNQPDTH